MLQPSLRVFGSYLKRDADIPEIIQRETAKTGRELETIPYEKQSKELKY